MTSRRARTRGSKRDRFTAEPSPELTAALEHIERMELPREVDPDVIVTKHGTTVDLRRPWSFPTGPKVLPQ